MTNKEFQEILAMYPDDYEICMDKTFGWEEPSNKYMCDPHLYINTDIGQIEIEPDEYRDIWVSPEERLPKDLEDVVVRTKCYGCTEICTYRAKKKQFRFWDYYNDSEAFYKIKEIDGWIPLPEKDVNKS